MLLCSSSNTNTKFLSKYRSLYTKQLNSFLSHFYITEKTRTFEYILIHLNICESVVYSISKIFVYKPSFDDAKDLALISAGGIVLLLSAIRRYAFSFKSYTV